MDRLGKLVDLVREEAGRQNLIARSTLDTLWSRHLVDSLQLLRLAPEGPWLDIGTGAGFPGLAIAVASDRPVTLAEPRARRVQFLAAAAEALGIADRVTIHAGRVETLPRRSFAVISARAVAALPQLFAMAHPLSDADTVWLLPKGRSAADELAAAAALWHGEMRLEPSLTDPAAAIVVARDLRPRTRP
jgi:16S rRNA (guanine527-N7)-methyltransferase